MVPIPIKTTTDCRSIRPTPPLMRPAPKKRAAAVAATLGPRRSTHGPPKAALSPSRTRAVVNVVYGGLNQAGSFGNSALIGRLNVLQEYTEPMHRWIATAAAGISQRLKG